MYLLPAWLGCLRFMDRLQINAGGRTTCNASRTDPLPWAFRDAVLRTDYGTHDVHTDTDLDCGEKSATSKAKWEVECTCRQNIQDIAFRFKITRPASQIHCRSGFPRLENRPRLPCLPNREVFDSAARGRPDAADI